MSVKKPRSLLLTAGVIGSLWWACVAGDAAEIAVGDELVVREAAPLMAGTRTIGTVEQGATAAALKLHGPYVLIEVQIDGKPTRGWINEDFVSSGGPPPPVPQSAGSDANQSSLSQSSLSKVTHFSAKQFNDFRKAAQKARELPQRIPEGWSISRVDPTRVVHVFPALQLKEGLVLRAYQFHEQGNGNGVVYALSKQSPFPDPNDVLKNRFGILQPPKPDGAVDDIMSVIQGDGTAASYLCASILGRELKEFGALWHGMNWTAHNLVSEDPWAGGEPAMGDDPLSSGPSGPISKWNWHGRRPTDWRPAVTVSDNSVQVSFYTYCGLHPEGIYHHLDNYRQGRYQHTTKQTKIATGPGGFAF